jgi:FkbM family methyltransferase
MALVEHIPPGALRWLGARQERPLIGPLVRFGAEQLRRRPRTVPHGQAKGLRIDASGSNLGYSLGTTEPLIQALVAEHITPDSVVWDVGANVGFYSLIASRLAKRVVAFEPLPHNCAALNRNLALNNVSNVTLVETAIADHVGRTDLATHDELTFAKIDTSQDTSFQQTATPHAVVTVDVSTLDEQLELYPGPQLLKLDVEGAEVAALRGATRLLRDVRPVIIIELHGTNKPIVDLLEASGYVARSAETPDVEPRDAHWNSHIVAVPG